MSKQNRTIIIAVSCLVIVVCGVGLWLAVSNGSEDATPTSSTAASVATTKQSQALQSTQAPEAETTASGRYEAYSETNRQDDSYDTTILFFHAPWRPECRAFDEAIKKSGVPDGVQILKVDYDTNQGLRKQYGVTVQTSFVLVNNDGEKQAAWIGYGKTKSVDAIIENTK